MRCLPEIHKPKQLPLSSLGIVEENATTTSLGTRDRDIDFY